MYEFKSLSQYSMKQFINLCYYHRSWTKQLVSLYKIAKISFSPKHSSRLWHFCGHGSDTAWPESVQVTSQYWISSGYPMTFLLLVAQLSVSSTVYFLFFDNITTVLLHQTPHHILQLVGCIDITYILEYSTTSSQFCIIKGIAFNCFARFISRYFYLTQAGWLHTEHASMYLCYYMQPFR